MEQADPCARFDVDGPTVAEGMADVFGVDDDAVVRAVIDADDKAISRETIVSLPKRWRFY
jgi:hypothetical protein